jgi:hypothetical protein
MILPHSFLIIPLIRAPLKALVFVVAEVVVLEGVVAALVVDVKLLLVIGLCFDDVHS